MKKNPANDIKDSMWDFLKDGQHEPDIEALYDGVYALIRMTTQKNAGQRGDSMEKALPFEALDLVKWQIICEAVALVLSGRLEELKNDTAGIEKA